MPRENRQESDFCDQVLSILRSDPEAQNVYAWIKECVPAENHCGFLNATFSYLKSGTLAEHILRRNFRQIEAAFEAYDSSVFI